MTINNTKKAVIYCRVSTKEQVDEGGSLTTQQNICKEYASKNGYTIVAVYIEEGESAKNAHRTQLRQMLDFCSDKKNGINAVIAYKVDRIARNIDDYRQIKLGLKARGVDIKSTSEFFEDTPSGRFMENMIANVAQFDNDVRTERSINGMRDAIRDGRFIWCAPIGYTNSKVGDKYNIVQSDMAPLVKTAFEEVSQNMRPVHDVWELMTKKGLTGRTGKPVNRSYFYKMMTNEVYMGWINGLGERIRGTFEPIVSEELFEQVQRVLGRSKHRSLRYKRDNEDFPLRRFIMHPTGKKLTGCWAQGRYKKYPYYFFRKGKLFNRDKLEGAFKEYLDTFRLTGRQADELRVLIKENLFKATEQKRKREQEIEGQIATLKVREKNLIQKNLDHVISDKILKEHLDLIDSELIKLGAQLSLTPITVNQLDKAYRFVEEYLKNPSDIWQKADLSNKLKLQWFDFPIGLTFDGEKFQTTEICCLFKVKTVDLPPKSPWVPPRVSSSNNVEVKSSLYWAQIEKEIIALSSIIQEIESKDLPP